MHRIIRVLFCLLTAAVMAFSVGRALSVRIRMEQAEEELRLLEEKRDDLVKESEQKRLRLREAGTDRRIEAFAREQLGLVLPQDRIYIIENQN